jgi:hypothetical protein
MTIDDKRARGYRFDAIRRSGLFGTLPATMLAPLGVALICAWAGVSGFVPRPVALPIAVIAGGLAFGKMRGRPAHLMVPALLRFGWRTLRGRHRWYRPVLLVVDDQLPVTVPDPLAGLELVEFDITWLHPGRATPLGAVHDRNTATVTGVLRVAGDGQFALVDPRSQELRLDGWGAALGGFCRERSDVLRVTWRDWSAPVPVRDQIGGLEARWHGEPVTPARDSYLRLMGDVAPQVVRHDVIVEVTVAVPRNERRRADSGGRLGAALQTLSSELALFRDRLDAAGLRVTGVLSASDLVTAMRVRSDPSAGELLAGLRQSLASAAGAAPPNFGPMAVGEHLTRVDVDRSVHRTWWFARWPRREVPAGWMDRLIFDAGCTRTISVVFEPIAPSRSDRHVDKELVSREANIESRQRRSFRVTGKDTKALAAAQAREDELNAGYAELSYVGLVTITAPDEETLEQQAAQLEQVAGQVGVELEPMWGQQAAGWVSSLPLGRSVARRMVAA